MATPNFEKLLPITYTGVFDGRNGRDATFTIGRKALTRPDCPFTGQVMVQITSGSKKAISGYASGGGYGYSKLADATGRESAWRVNYVIAVRPGMAVKAYPYLVGAPAEEDMNTPVAITFTPIGQHET